MKIPPNNLKELLSETLTEFHATEKKLLKSVTQLADSGLTQELKTAVSPEGTNAESQLERLEIVMKNLKLKTSRISSPLSEELIKLAKDTSGFKKQVSLLKDAQIIQTALMINQFKISTYHTLHLMLTRLGHNMEATLLEQSLSESKNNAAYLLQVAENIIYAKTE
ncbi:MAG: DUF892 family protein [Pedobacter sp.]|nr:MAG: DUF892 family protein [Pedobacter sp.]